LIMEYIDLCKAVKRQRQLKELKEETLETLQKLVGDEETAKRIYNYLQNCKEGYMKIRRIRPSRGEEHEGWTFVFAEGLPLHLDTPLTWYSTSNIVKIDWKQHVFTTQNSEYFFKFKNDFEK